VIVNANTGVDPPALVGDGAARPAGAVESDLFLTRSGHRGGSRAASTQLQARSREVRRDDRGAVTAETAVTIPSLIVLVVIFVWIILVVTAQMRVVDAARAGARAAARGESVVASIAIAKQAAPPGATADITQTGTDLRVAVRVEVQPPGGIPLLPSISVDAVAYAAAEDVLDRDHTGDDP
jgi:hypothetical protein